MKRFATLFAIVALVSSCLTQPVDDRALQTELTELMERWEQAIRTEDPDLYLSTYWDNAGLEIALPNGEGEMLRGIDALLENQMGYFERFDMAGFRLPEDREAMRSEDGSPMLIVRFEGGRVEEFHFEEREGEWRIIFQAIHATMTEEPEAMAEMAVPVESPLQELYDGDRNGRLGPRELERYFEDFRGLVSEPHEVVSPLDERLDRDENGVIEPYEIEAIRNFFFVEQLRRSYRYDPEFARQLDVNRDEYLSLWEIEIVPIVFFHDPRWRNPRGIEHPLDERIDQNNDRELDEIEIRRFMERVFRRIALMPVEVRSEGLRFGTFEEVFRWADIDEDGEINEQEMGDLGFSIESLFQGEERVAVNPVLRYFDRNKDGFLDHLEVQRAREQFAFQLIQAGRDEPATDEELELLIHFLQTPMEGERRRVESPIDRRADANGDGILYEEERTAFVNEVLFRTAITWIENPEWHDNWSVRTVLDELVDTDGDGMINRGENEQLVMGVARPHNVESPLDRRLDVNANGVVDDFEIGRAKRAGLPGGSIEEPEQARGPYPVKTLVDERLDLNGDGEVDDREINMIIRFFERGVQADGNTPAELVRLVDFNNNGTVEREELLVGRERYLVAHPVDADSELDRKLDSNRDGFVDPDEIGIAAGVSEIGPLASILERLEVGGWRSIEDAVGDVPRDDTAATADGDDATESTERFAAEFSRKIGQIQDKKLAVVDLDAATKNVDEETSKGLIIFIENAFVNVGKASVVDRKNIEKLIEEQKFQLSGITDEATAVEIGKLSGADIVVIGSISYVGEKYYLNVKLILVETGEIIGSSISEAADQTEFLEMTNEAVYKLF